MPTPVPTERKPKLRTSLARPRQRSPSAARLTSFSTPMRSAELVPQRRHQALAAPAGQVGGQGDRAPGRLEHARAADGDVVDPVPADAGLGGQPVGDGAELADQGAGAGGLGPLVAAGDHVAGDVGQGGPDPPAADVDAHHPAGRRVELVEDGAGPGPAAGPADLPDQPGVQQRAEAERDGRLGEAAVPRHLGPGDRAGALDPLEDGAGVDRPQQARRAHRGRPLGQGSSLL